MAHSKVIVFFLVLLVIFSLQIQPIEGRNLKLKVAIDINAYSSAKILNTNVAPTVPPPPPVPVSSDSRPPPPGHVNDFRPTTPGHSPGIGHSSYITRVRT
ncbi:Hypothetical predicted protein [Olea europaea subsp. europaea]|uniref:Transmembrane protein n=1 Tax=Olea europaea subsp. europaea TaxID=158383 RepID=A0A8S0VNH0_OLEEU|nr:Hypothetical predicted protein [Olea europaea subsp. europaea]